MDKLSGRVGALTAEQRALLEARMKKKGLQDPSPDNTSGTGAGLDERRHGEDLPAVTLSNGDREMNFGLYFFSDDGSSSGPEKYKLLLASAKFADQNGFCAVWTPERHFQAFGGIYPNPSVTSAALAVLTTNVEIRAGSVALPLHHPVRVAEEWSVVDNLSGGRVAVSFASGWHPDDFIFAPSVYENRKDVMFDYIKEIQRLWAGEDVTFGGPNESAVSVRALPRPIQPRLPVWITTAGSPATWIKAGEIGANVLCALVGYPFEDLAQRINEYRAARERCGHDPASGRVSAMVHTYIGEDDAAVKALVRQPMCKYLRSYFQQFEGMVAGGGKITEEDKMAIVSRAFDSYYDESLLIGTPGKCERLVDRLSRTGVDELACLVDFGLDFETVMEGLDRLAKLRRQYDRVERLVAAGAPAAHQR